MLSSCSSLKVNYDMDQSVDFNQFSTFSFYPWDYKHGFQINDYDKQTIMIAIKDGLESKGYKIHILNLDEFAKGMGGPNCLIMPVKRGA